MGRRQADGTIDLSFHPGTGADASVSALVLRPDGRLDLGGSFNSFDDVPRPKIAQEHGPLRTTDIRVSPLGFSLSVATATGRTYWLESTEELDQPSWKSISSVIGNGLAQTPTDPSQRAARFYRARIE
jgi:hypothetical protein